MRHSNALRFSTAILVGAIVFAMCPLSAAPRPGQILTFTGLGPVRIGMTVREAEAALGAKLARRPAWAAEECWVTERRDGSTPGITYMIEGGLVVRIDISKLGPSTVSRRPRAVIPPDMTEDGIGIGSSEQSIIAKYGSRLEISELPPYEDSEGHDITLTSEDGANGIWFRTFDGEVAYIFAGTLGGLSHMEGCQ